jgi:hypothetical protein
VAAGVVVDGVVQPAASASMNTATRLRAMMVNLLCFPFMVFYHPYPGSTYTDFRHNLYDSIYTIDSYRVKLINTYADGEV